VLTLLSEKNIQVLSEIPRRGAGTVLLRAHGVPPAIKHALETAGFNVIDAACPRVIRVQTIIHRHAKEGFDTIIVGDENHPEVTGLLGFADGRGHAAGGLEDLRTLPEFENAVVVAQTTQDTAFYQEVKDYISGRYPHYKIYDTICDSTEKRQAEVVRLAQTVDAVIVVGGKESGNTKRLAEIAAKTGKPAYHIESEADLESVVPRGIRSVGITAGASTPNWILRKVHRTLEIRLLERGKGGRRFVLTAMRFLLLTNIYLSIGAGGLSLCCIRLLGLRPVLPYVFIAVLYVQSMHILNHLMGRKEDRYNDPDRAAFYDNRRHTLAVSALAAGGLGLWMAFRLGRIPFLPLLAMSVMGLSYNIRLLPEQWTGGKSVRLRDIPGAKTVLIAAAWGVVTSLLPALSIRQGLDVSAASVFLWATGMVFVRTAFCDLLDMQGDRIVGRETIPLVLGEKTSRKLLKGMLAAFMAAPPLMSAFGLTTGLGFAVWLCPLWMMAVLTAYERRLMQPGVLMEFALETQFVLAGLTAAIQMAITAG
jgi:4-hydroxy-3-methylbut-2-enyl diphosphate reductase